MNVRPIKTEADYQAALEIIVTSDDGKIGTLLISEGNIEWLPKGNSVNKRRLPWAKFAEFMEQHGKPAKVR